MNLIPKICELLGVEVWEEWLKEEHSKKIGVAESE